MLQVSFLEFGLFLVECGPVYKKLNEEWKSLEPGPLEDVDFLEHLKDYPFGASHIKKEKWEQYANAIYQCLYS